MFKNLFKKKNVSEDVSKTKENIVPKNDNKPKSFFEKIKSKLAPVLKNKLGKSAIQGEEILGVEITATEIRLAQVTSNNSNQWILEKFYIHPTNLPEDTLVLDKLDALGSELELAIQRSKITTTNAAIAIPVTSAIIRVVTAPLMKDEELNKAIETN